ncbi:MAG: hypothetical protein FWG84_10130 [Bacteroidales bacterium]|nr:hypothetical protein [Bacteroidales bacterium]
MGKPIQSSPAFQPSPDGTHRLQIGADVSSRIYFLHLTTASGVVVRKVIKN